MLNARKTRECAREERERFRRRREKGGKREIERERPRCTRGKDDRRNRWLHEEPTDFDDVLKVDGRREKIGFNHGGGGRRRERKMRPPSSKNASFVEKDLAEGEEKERDEDDSCESWERMRTESHGGVRKARIQTCRGGSGKRWRRCWRSKKKKKKVVKKESSVVAGESIAGVVAGNEKEEALEAAIACEEEDAQWHKGSYRKAETLYALRGV